MSTFLELVNTAVEEAKISLDPLTSVDFANPPRTTMYNKIKRWVNVAYKELFMARPEWYFRKERTSISVWPRLHLAGLTTIPSVGDVITADSSGVIFTVVAVHSFEEVDEDLTNEATLSVEFDDSSDPSTLIMREQLTCNPLLAGPDYAAGYLKGYGRYDFRSDVTNLQSIDPSSVRVFNAPDDAEPVLDPNGAYIEYIPYDKWNMDYEFNPWAGNYPIYITETPLGTYDLFPKPSREFILAFDYSRSIPELTAYNDVPEGIPSEYQDYLMWRAVEEFADFDNNRTLYSRAHKHVENYRNWLDRDQKQEPKFAESKFNRGW